MMSNCKIPPEGGSSCTDKILGSTTRGTHDLCDTHLHFHRRVALERVNWATDLYIFRNYLSTFIFCCQLPISFKIVKLHASFTLLSVLGSASKEKENVPIFWTNQLCWNSLLNEDFKNRWNMDTLCKTDAINESTVLSLALTQYQYYIKTCE